MNRAYREAKEQAFEETVNALEQKTKPWFGVFFLVLLILAWLAVTSTAIGPVQIYEAYGFLPIIVIFLISYFSVFLGSQIFFRPTKEELTDDTSTFAVFSACERREWRSLISIGLSLFHTLVFVLYLISKDAKLMELF